MTKIQNATDTSHDQLSELEDCPEDWLDVDLALRSAIENYKDLTIEIDG